ncbi:hypothetical protein Patl1_24334 [Pistacia atlantica]|uniref:Uncharacterized protein n=1 Tax=Pistacia atlantica TaxID=434234 RepID=A0ACC1A0E6_9ROSI|nr:hypothetical protein Patl1_24334 [Pistacia atlantica]
MEETIQIDSKKINAQYFTFRELATATNNFRQECLLGEGGFGRVYKGTLQSTGQVVAVKQLDRNGQHGNREFLVEVLRLSLLNHPNLVNFIGYCADGDQRLLLYEFMPGGTVEDRLIANTDDVEVLYMYPDAMVVLAYCNCTGRSAEPIFKDPKRFPDMADPHLKKQFPERSLNQAVAIAAMCLQDEPSTRPLISDVVTTLSFLSEDTEKMCSNRNEQRNFDQDGEYSGIDQEQDYSNEEISKGESSNRPEISEGSVSSRSFAASKSLQEGNAPLHSESSRKSNDVGVISSNRSSKGSGFGISGQNGSKKLQSSFTLKRNGSDYLGSRKQINKTVSLAKQISTRISQEGSIGSRNRSMKLKDRTMSSRRKGFRKSYESLDDTATSAHSRMSEDPLSEVTLLYP